MVVMCGLILIRKKALLNDMWDVMRDRGFTLTSGYLAVMLGLITIILHNEWTRDYRLLVTLFGWISLIKGIVLIGSPDTIENVSRKFKKNNVLTNAALVLGLLIGAWLLWASASL